MTTDQTTSRSIEWGPLLLVAVGALLFLLGASRFLLAPHWGLRDALYCCAAIIPAALLLLVISYVIQHALLVSVLPLAFAASLAYSSPAFDVAFGLVLMGIVGEAALSDRKYKQSLRKSNDTSDDKKCPPELPAMPAEERADKLRRLQEQKSAGERAYDEMYEAHSSGHASACYSEAKESFYTAIALAGELGLAQEAEDLEKRLLHIKSVFRSQFS